MSASQKQVIHLLNLDLNDIDTLVRNMDIKTENVYPKKNPTGHLKFKFMHPKNVTLTIGITTHGIIIIIVKSMDTFDRILLRYISEISTRNGWIET